MNKKKFFSGTNIKRGKKVFFLSNISPKTKKRKQPVSNSCSVNNVCSQKNDATTLTGVDSDVMESLYETYVMGYITEEQFYDGVEWHTGINRKDFKKLMDEDRGISYVG